MSKVRPLSGRSCDGCTQCCRLLMIEELDKPQGELCRHCELGSGCTIYDGRPSVCRGFFCGYLIDPAIGRQWHPLRSNMILVLTPDRVTIHVDPNHPDAWRKEPYYGELRRWAVLGAADMRQVIVYVGRHGTILLPDRNVDLGELDGDEQIITREVSSAFGTLTEAFALKPGDPRIDELLSTGRFVSEC